MSDLNGFEDGDPFDDKSKTVAPQRSVPGQGERVTIYNADLPGCDSWGHIWSGEAEDFAVTSWPVTVKIKPNISHADAARLLREIADSLEAKAARETEPEALSIDFEQGGLDD